MIHIYTTPSCSSCRKAKKWFDQYEIPYQEKNIFSIKLSRQDIYNILRNSENGFEDIISTRSKIIKENNIDIESMTISELTDFIVENPSILRRPIIFDDKKMQIGYNDEEIRVFLPRELRDMTCSHCTGEDEEDIEEQISHEVLDPVQRFLDAIKNTD